MKLSAVCFSTPQLCIILRPFLPSDSIVSLKYSKGWARYSCVWVADQTLGLQHSIKSAALRAADECDDLFREICHCIPQSPSQCLTSWQTSRRTYACLPFLLPLFVFFLSTLIFFCFVCGTFSSPLSGFMTHRYKFSLSSLTSLFCLF